MHALALLLALCAAAPLTPGTHQRSLTVDQRERSYRVHVPTHYDAAKPTPVVLIFHGAGMNADRMADMCGMDQKADEAGFVAVYPNGLGIASLLVFNAGRVAEKEAEHRADDVKFTSCLLDDLATVVRIDAKRVYATGYSNGGMMCYRLASELSNRIAAIAPVAGAVSPRNAKPARAVPVMHFHGTADHIVPWKGLTTLWPGGFDFTSVDTSIATWTAYDDCPKAPKVESLEDKADDGTTVRCKRYGPGCDGSEVVLYVIDNGGHTWPGRKPHVPLMGKTSYDISANDLIWAFFEKHAMPETVGGRADGDGRR